MRPDAPSFLAVDKLTGKVIWSSNAPGKNICYGQWSTPALANVNGESRNFIPRRRWRLYAFEPLNGKQLWRVDCRAETQKRYYYVDDFISAPPLVVGHTAYVSPATDCEASLRWAPPFADRSRIRTRFDGPSRPRDIPARWDRWRFLTGAVYAAGILARSSPSMPTLEKRDGRADLATKTR